MTTVAQVWAERDLHLALSDAGVPSTDDAGQLLSLRLRVGWLIEQRNELYGQVQRLLLRRA